MLDVTRFLRLFSLLGVHRVRHALCGSYALTICGHSCATDVIDFGIDAHDLDRFKAVLATWGGVVGADDADASFRPFDSTILVHGHVMELDSLMPEDLDLLGQTVRVSLEAFESCHSGVRASRSAIDEVWSLAGALVIPTPRPRGVRKFRSYDDLQEARRAWRVQQMRSAREQRLV